MVIFFRDFSQGNETAFLDHFTLGYSTCPAGYHKSFTVVLVFTSNAQTVPGIVAATPKTSP